MVTRTHTLTMRDMNQILSRLALVNPEVFTRWLFGWQEILVSMILFRFIMPELERRSLDGTLTIEDVRTFYGISPEIMNEEKLGKYNHRAWIISGLWEHVITNGALPEKDREKLSTAFDEFGCRNPQEVPRTIHVKHLSKFDFLGGER